MIEDSFFNTSAQKYEKSLVRIIKSTPCQQVSEPLLRDYVKEIVALPGFERIIICPDFKASGGEAAIQDFRISQDLESQKFRSVSMKVYPCSLEDPAECVGHQKLLGMRSDYTKNDRVLKSSEFKNPLVKNYYRGIATIDVSSTKILNEDIRKTKIIDDINRFGPPKVKLEFAKNIYGKSDFKMRDRNQLHCSKEQIYSEGGGGCQEYVTYDLHISSEVEIIRRNYKSFTTLLGELGGLLKILTTAVFFFYSIYNYKRMTNAFAELIFKLDSRVLEVIEAKEKETRLSARAQRPKKEQRNISLENRGSELTPDVGTISVEKAVKEIVKERVSAEGLIDKLNFLELLENVFFTDFEKKLIPLVLLQVEIKNSKMEKPESSPLSESKTRKKKGSPHLESISKRNQEGRPEQRIPKTEHKDDFKREVSRGEFQRSTRPGSSDHSRAVSSGQATIENLRNEHKGRTQILEEYEAAFKTLKFDTQHRTLIQGIRGPIQSFIIENLNSLLTNEQK